jgi:hypothetical protein
MNLEPRVNDLTDLVDLGNTEAEGFAVPLTDLEPAMCGELEAAAVDPQTLFVGDGRGDGEFTVADRLYSGRFSPDAAADVSLLSVKLDADELGISGERQIGDLTVSDYPATDTTGSSDFTSDDRAAADQLTGNERTISNKSVSYKTRRDKRIANLRARHGGIDDEAGFDSGEPNAGILVQFGVTVGDAVNGLTAVEDLGGTLAMP